MIEVIVGLVILLLLTNTKEFVTMMVGGVFMLGFFYLLHLLGVATIWLINGLIGAIL
jgi:hypothetical protein